jgi:hypothetical protein
VSSGKESQHGKLTRAPWSRRNLPSRMTNAGTLAPGVRSERLTGI